MFCVDDNHGSFTLNDAPTGRLNIHATQPAQAAKVLFMEPNFHGTPIVAVNDGPLRLVPNCPTPKSVPGCSP